MRKILSGTGIIVLVLITIGILFGTPFYHDYRRAEATRSKTETDLKALITQQATAVAQAKIEEARVTGSIKILPIQQHAPTENYSNVDGLQMLRAGLLPGEMMTVTAPSDKFTYELCNEAPGKNDLTVVIEYDSARQPLPANNRTLQLSIF